MSKLPDDFAVFILTHGRPYTVKTVATLRRCGYTGPVYLIVDNEDKAIYDYVSVYGKEFIIVFDKAAYALQADNCGNFYDRRTITHARNASFDVAKYLGYKYFMQLDDDYRYFEHRHIIGDKGIVKNIRDLDSVLAILLDFYKSIPALSIAIAQGGDFIGGTYLKITNGFPVRKCMNSFICSTERPFSFIGTLNEDVNTYVTLGSRGDLFLTVPFASLVQTRSQSQDGGITETYLKFGTYVKALTTVMLQPASTCVTMMGGNMKVPPRIHHHIAWRQAVPCIIRESHKKKVA